MLQYRKAMTNFQAIAAERANTQVESSLQMELLSRIAGSQRGLKASRADRVAIVDLIERLEKVQAAPPQQQQQAAATAAAAAAEARAVADEAAALNFQDEKGVEGEWHLEFVSNGGDGVEEGWDFAASTDAQEKRVSHPPCPRAFREGKRTWCLYTSAMRRVLSFVPLLGCIGILFFNFSYSLLSRQEKSP